MMKKGSLNLSIQAIVIVVIAFVVLGLGLGFVRTQFKSITDSSSAVQEQVRGQILDDLRRGDKKLSFPAQEVTLSKKDASVLGIGVKNTGNQELIYEIVIEQTAQGARIFGTEINDNFLYVVGQQTLAPTDTRVESIRVTTETTSGTGQFKISLVEPDGNVYDSKNFFITVN